MMMLLIKKKQLSLYTQMFYGIYLFVASRL